MDKDKLNLPVYRDFIGDMLKSQTEKGEMDNLKGAGKPLSKEYLSGDTFQHFQRIAKDAGYKPHWLKLQHVIRDQIFSIVEMKPEKRIQELNLSVAQVNEKINEHNKCCPTPLQKGRVTLENIEDALGRW